MLYRIICIVREKVLVLLTHHAALPLLRLIRSPARFPFDMQALSALPPGTVGFELFTLLSGKNLRLLPHYAKHDLKHVILNYDTTGPGEVSLQFFMLGNRHCSFPVLATVLFGVCTMPEHWSLFRKAFQRGRAAEYIESWPWTELVVQPLQYWQHKAGAPDPFANH